MSKHPRKNYNPLFIYGGVGLRKTHLINAIGHETLVKKGGGSVVYLSSESTDHTTVLYACHTIETRLKQDGELRDILTRIEIMIAH